MGDKILGAAVWNVGDGRREERFVVFTVRAGRIIDMQGCVNRREADRLMRHG